MSHEADLNSFEHHASNFTAPEHRKWRSEPRQQSSAKRSAVKFVIIRRRTKRTNLNHVQEGDGRMFSTPCMHNVCTSRVLTPHSPCIVALDGPISVLLDSLQRRARVRVVVRSPHARYARTSHIRAHHILQGVRGHCTGYLVAFDSHMNMVLLDVRESYQSKEAAPKAR